MQAIYIPHLITAPNKMRVIEIDDHLPDLETLTPVKGQLQIQHRGNFLEVSVQADAIITLTCHRCLQHYNHRTQLDCSEFIWLQDAEPEEFGVEREVAVDDLVDMLPPEGHFNPETWLYEQFCLAIPQRQLCDQGCPGIEVESDKETTAVTTDHRWAALASLKNQLAE